MARDMNAYGPISRVWHALVICAIFAVSMLAPYLIFHVKPFPTGNRGAEAAPGVTSHTPIMSVRVAREDALERQVRADVYKWCGFCHTTTKNGEHLLGPNLYGIVGQRAGTVPNFMNYSDAMMQARDMGLVWTDQALMDYIADPQKFMPGTNMAISIGAIPDVEVQKRVVNILKKETMGETVVHEGSRQP
jgi:cytochrome c2